MRNNVIDFQPKETKKINKKKLAITISIIVVLLTISILAIIYCLNKNFRKKLGKGSNPKPSFNFIIFYLYQALCQRHYELPLQSRLPEVRLHPR